MGAAPVRVLVTAFAPVPGTSPHAQALIGMAAALRAELDLVTIKTDTFGHLEVLGNARMFRVPVGAGSAAEQREAFVRAVARQLEAQPYDVVHVRGPVEGRVVAGRRKALGFLFVYEVATFPDEAEGAGAERGWIEAHDHCAEAADLILVPTEAAARSMGERGHAGKVAVVPPGVDVNTFDWWPSGDGEARRLLYLGTFAADRDLGTVLGAIREVSKKIPVEALIAGDPDFDRRERLRTVVRSFGLSEVVTVRGEPRPEAIPLLIGAADICLAPASATPRFQDHGDLPQPLLEYLACRRPVIAAGVPGLSDVLRDDKEGLVYPPGDERVLADSILSLAGNAQLRARVVELAYDRARWLFSTGARRRRIAEVYEMLVTGSQTYDPWDEAFGSDLTGEVRLPSGMHALEAEAEAASPALDAAPPGPPLAGEILYVPEETPDEHATPAYERQVGEDTSPGLAAGEDEEELAASPTLLTAAPRSLDSEATGEVPGPPRPKAKEPGDASTPGGAAAADTGDLAAPAEDDELARSKTRPRIRQADTSD